VISREVKLGIKKRIEKLEAFREQNEIDTFCIATVECGENGYPVDEKNLEIYRNAEARKAEAVHAGKQGIWVICICKAGFLGLDQKIKAAAEAHSPTLVAHIEPAETPSE
jgi:hypothetical protein